MGQLRFRIHDRDCLAPGALERIYVVGAEEIPWSTQAQFRGDLLVLQRTSSESGCVTVPWLVEGLGQCVLTTATLMERERPYQLEVELARGLIQRIRNRRFMWEWLGLETPAELVEKLRQATREFSLAATSQADPSQAATAACRAIALALTLAEELTAKYAQQAINLRQTQTRVSTLLGVTLNAEAPSVEVRRQLVEICNMVQLPIPWRTVEAREGQRDWKATDAQLAWCQKAGLKVAAGPLLRMDDVGVPDWMYLWEGDFDNLARLLVDHVRAVVSRYAGRVHLWQVASRVNTGKLLSLEEEQRLHLVAQAIEVVRRLDPRAPVVVSFDQPWGEYMAASGDELAPLHYADALVRADLGISGFALEINAGYQPGGTTHRPTLEYDRLIDQWSVWGLPLMCTLSAPSSAKEDFRARRDPAIEIPLGADPAQHDLQREWVAAVLPLLLARSAVQVIMWNELTDAVQHEFPHAGLFDGKNQAKPALALLGDLSKICLA